MNWLNAQIESALPIVAQFYINGTLDRNSFANILYVKASLSNAVQSNGAAMRLGESSCENRSPGDATDFRTIVVFAWMPPPRAKSAAIALAGLIRFSVCSDPLQAESYAARGHVFSMTSATTP